ncbi:uncharacterized protein LOC119589053 isoform X2 [Penaeus monodon]|uniref:uncharacterized protein LOC119589053 isoform X2 n=1 Tax=Penaeus monodon TaxID=6687 RepID=UPI0018A78942|nr:uncharacterized protein LOC119589053 isoform X2 [Penaeus monodon]
MERTIKIKKGADQLGVNIEVVDQGVNGVVVSSLVRNGAVHKDGRLHAGDFILSVNNESMRNITNSQARAILRRTQLVSTDVSICYIRGQDAAAFREASLLQYRSGQQEQHQQSQQPQQQTSPRSPYVPRGDSSEDETGGGINSDLTRSITAPSFITRDLRSRDPSHEDLLGSISSLPHQPETEVGGLTVINIKHALSETLADTRAEESNISSVHIGGEESKNIEDESEEGPFTITFKNVSEAHPEYNPKVGLEPEAEDHEVLGVLQGDGVSSGRPPGGEPCLYTNPECITNIHILTGTSEPSVTNQFIVNNRIGNNLAGIESDFQTPDSLELTSGASANLYQQSSSRLVRFAESKGRSEHSESSDSSAERSSSLFVECDSDRHSVSDVLSDDLNTPSAKLVVAHLTDVESVVQKRSIVTSRSFDESPHIQKSYFERQYSEVIPDSSYLAHEQVIPQEQRERNQSIDSRYRNEPLVGEPNRLVKSESNPVCISRKELIIAEPLHPKGFEGLTQSTVDSEPEIQRSSGPVIYRKDLSPDSNHTSATTVTPTATRTVTTPVTAISSVLPSLSTTTITNMTVTQGLTAAPSEGRSSTASPMLDGKHWGPERTVEVRRDDKNSLGISIVGGKVDLSWSGSSVTGIFIKNVLPDSPAGKGGHLKTGDRILEVEGVDLRGATHEKAVEVIKKTGNPVTFVVQSLVQWTPANSAPPSRDASRLGTRMPNSISPARTPTPELIQASTPLSEGSSHQQPIQPTERHHPPDPRVTFPVAPPIPETSTPIHELYPEPVKFVPESPISEPDDPDPLVNPYYYYAHAALAHWHERAQRTQEQVPEGDGNNSDQENSTSSSSASSTASRRFLQLRSFGNSSEVQGRTVTENKLDTPPSDVPLMDTPPSDVPPMDDSPEDEPKPSEVPVVEIEPLTKEIHNLQTEPAAVPPLPIITKCTDHIENAPHPTRLMLDDFPLDLPLDDPPVGAYTYDWRTDPHLYQGWWCVEGSVSEHLAAQVPTQPVSPYDSPADTPTPNTPTTDQVRLPISILPTHAYAPNPPSFLHPDWALKVIGHSMKLTCDVAQRDTISVHNITIP